MSVYKPISCTFYDELEALATLKKVADIHYLDNGQPKSIQSVIVNFRIRDKAEYMVLKENIEIRLDNIVSVNGKKLKDFC